MMIQEALKRLTNGLPHEDPKTAWWLLEWITGKTQTELIIKYHEQLSDAQQLLLEKTLKEIIDEHKPIQYILGSVPFLSLDITVRPPILIPRPETEFWCSWLIEKLKTVGDQPLMMLDLCTGSGCIGLSLAHAFPNATIYASDISEEACSLAKENAQKNHITNIKIVESDLFKDLPKKSFDIIVSNPPYIAPEEWPTLQESVKGWEDMRALITPDAGLALITKIIEAAPSHLEKNSVLTVNDIPQLVIEIGYLQGISVKYLMSRAGFSNVSVHKDQSGNDRFVTGKWQ